MSSSLKSNKPSLSVFFPAYNEAKNIETAVKSASAILPKITSTYQVIIVDDGSTDETGKIADQLAAQDKYVSVVHHHDNQGYGKALRSGLKAAKYDWIFFTDADLQFRFSEIKKLLKYSDDYDAIIGFRARRSDLWPRKIYASGWNFLNRLLFGLKVRDINCAFKLFRRKVVAALPLQSSGAMVSAEILVRLTKKGVAIKEVAVTHQPRKHGSPTGAKLGVILRAFKEMFGLYEKIGRPLYVSMLKFVIVGGVNTMVDWSIYFSLTRTDQFFLKHLVLAKSVSFLCGTVPSYIGNKYWTFRQPKPIQLLELYRFYIAVGSALVINVTVLYVLVTYAHLYDLLAVVLATVASFIWNFTLARLWVFRPIEKLGQ